MRPAVRRGARGAVIGSGGLGAWPPPEARAIRDGLVAAGVPEAAILEEDRSHDTFENALHTIPLMRARGLGPALVVSDAYHLPRARDDVPAARHGGDRVAAGPGAAAARGWVRAHLREALALPVYLARGARLAAAAPALVLIEVMRGRRSDLGRTSSGPTV